MKCFLSKGNCQLEIVCSQGECVNGTTSEYVRRSDIQRTFPEMHPVLGASGSLANLIYLTSGVSHSRTLCNTEIVRYTRKFSQIEISISRTRQNLEEKNKKETEKELQQQKKMGKAKEKRRIKRNKEERKGKNNTPTASFFFPYSWRWSPFQFL